MIDGSGWLDWVIRRPGIADKVYSQPNAGLGFAFHSIEGTDAGAEGRFDSTDKNADGSYTSYAAASVMFINPKIGVLIQCYPVTASTWTSGNGKANTTLWGVESEGIWSEPLNPNQIANLIRLCREWEVRAGKVATRDPASRTLWEHREVWNWATPNAGPTACPSERYAPFYAALEVDDMMTPEMLEMLSIASGDFENARIMYNALLVAPPVFDEVKLTGGHLDPIAMGLNEVLTRWRVLENIAYTNAAAAVKRLS